MRENARVRFDHWNTVDKGTLDEALAWCGAWQAIVPGKSVLLKPNLTFPFYQPGVTTPPGTLRALTELLLDRGARVTICEGGPSLDVYSTQGAFAEHGILDLHAEYGVRVVDLCTAPLIYRNFGRKPAGQGVPIPCLLAETDVYMSMPVAKVHAMTVVSLALKNNWGLIPTKKRFLLHSAIDDILVGLAASLPPAFVVCDASTVLDGNGPMFGIPRPGGFLAVANDVGAFDFALARLMGFDPARIPHLRAGMRAGLVPSDDKQITFNADPAAFRPFRFTLRRTLQNYIALAGFRNRWICKLGYDSSFLSDLLHKALYRVKGNPLQQAMAERDAGR